MGLSMRTSRVMCVGAVCASVLAMSAGEAAAGDRRGGGGRGGRGWSDCNDSWNVRYSSHSGWRSSGSSFSISIGSGWNDCYPSRVYCPPVRRVAYYEPVAVCPPPVVVTRPVVISRPVYTQPVVVTQPVVYQPVYTQQVVQPVVQQTRVIETTPVVQTVATSAPAPVVQVSAPVGEPPNPATSAAEDLTRALAAANQGEDRRAVELMRAYFRTYTTPPAGLVISRPMLERLAGAYARRCETEEPSSDTYFVLAVVRGLLGERELAVAAVDAGRAWGDRDASTETLRAWLETR